MNTISKTKNISKEYGGVSVNEKDLSYLAKLVQDVAKKKDAKISIELISADKEDVIRSNNHTIFFSDDIPTDIDSIMISLTDYRTPMTCRINLDPNFFKPVEVTIYGEEIETVNALFREIDRELTKLKFQDIMKFKYLNRFWYSFLLGIILGLASFSFFDIVLEILDTYVIGFDGSIWNDVSVNIAWFVILSSVIFGSTYATSKLQKIFPKIRFTGKFQDRYSKQRKSLIWVFGFLILPIFLNILSNLLFN